MADSDIRKRHAATSAQAEQAASAHRDRNVSPPAHTKPTGKEHGVSMQVLRGILLFTWMNTCCVVIHVTQLFGAWLYLVSRDTFYWWMKLTKESFGLLITTITQWFAPMTVRISGSRDCRAQIKLDGNGRLDSTALPHRMVLIANHQLYSDWLFLWWIAYTARLHGYIYIILKESLKWIPVIGPGMQFYRFIFMARNWAKDQSRLKYRLSKLNTKHAGRVAGDAAGSAYDPMWLMIFPEGTNLSANTRQRSKSFADKTGIDDLKHCILPRSTGLLCCLQELKTSVDWVYDCTVAYEGIPRGEYGQDVYTNRGIYFGGRAPKSVNMHWRRFHMASIPLDSHDTFDEWLMDRWREKDALLEHYAQTGRFPADTDTPAWTPASSMVFVKDEDSKTNGADLTASRAWGGDSSGKNSNSDYLETQVSVNGVLDVASIFAPLTAIAAFAWIVTELCRSWLA